MTLEKEFKLKRLILDDSKIFEEFIETQKHPLSAYSFISIYIWKDIFNFYWRIFEGALCLFAKYGLNVFMYIPPIGNGNIKNAIEWSFDLMKTYNKNKKVIRIENIEEDKIRMFNSLGYKISLRGYEYIYNAKSLIELKGNSFKDKRSAYNYFVKNYEYSYEDFKKDYTNECLKLYRIWQDMRLKKFKDQFFRVLTEDSFSAHRCAMENYSKLKLIGRIVRINNRIKAYSLGFKLNEDIFCILFEIA
ncbi:MAG: DUF2156 domain-containing protein, partial [Candidatus Omnitrophica bacterium]|nr:DUF2156 domain-containing protein [Candidatus Omnitrophota bacterium]